jgi:hypothetical protein
MKDALHEYLNIFMMIYRSALLKMKNISEKLLEKIEHAFYIQSLSFLILLFMRKCGKI